MATAVDTDVVGALTLATPGLYPVAVQVLVDGDVVAEHDTFLERLPADGDDGASMSVAIVAATPDPGPAATAAELAAGRRRVAEIAATAAAVDGPITVAIPPVLLDGLAAADPALDAVVRSSFDGDEVLAAPADVLDPSSAVAIDQGDAFTRDLLRGEDALDDALAVRATRETGWLVPDEISTDATTLLRNLGFRSLVLTPEIYDGLDGSIGGYFDTTLAIGVDLGDAPPFPAKVVDASSSLLDPATLDRQRPQPDGRRRPPGLPAGDDPPRARRRPRAQRRPPAPRRRRPRPRRLRPAGHVRRRSAGVRHGSAVGAPRRRRTRWWSTATPRR